MQHSVAIGANGAQVRFWIDLILGACVGYGLEVVNFDIACAKSAIGGLEVESTNATAVTVMFNTGLACGAASVICPRSDLLA